MGICAELDAREMEQMVALSRLGHFFKQGLAAFEARVAWVRQAVSGIWES
jgi:hypothetical protein